jgi:argininosuccinate lyase
MKLWGGRFRKDTDELLKSFSSSLSFDRRLASRSGTRWRLPSRA